MKVLETIKQYMLMSKIMLAIFKVKQQIINYIQLVHIQILADMDHVQKNVTEEYIMNIEQINI